MVGFLVCGKCGGPLRSLARENGSRSYACRKGPGVGGCGGIRIQANGGLSDADIEEMIKNAEANKADDEKRKALIEARNQADALIHSTEKSLKEFGDKVQPADKTAIETALADLKTAKDGEDAEDIRAKSNTLIQASMKLGEAMYGQAGGEDGEAAAARDAEDDGVVDAEFEEVDNDKKSA